MKPPGKPNVHELRESWLRAAVNELRPYFASVGYVVPDRIRVAIGFPSTGRNGKRFGECWHSGSSADGFYEIFLRADLEEPMKVLGVLVKELVHTTLPPDAKHGKLFKEAAVRIGLIGPMREAVPGVLLTQRLSEVAAALGPLPHARLAILDTPLIAVAATAIDRPKKQGTRMLPATCPAEDCAYLVRLSEKQARGIGAPICPKHNVAMLVDFPKDSEVPEAAA